MEQEKKDKYINIFTDYGFKKLFGTELNKEVLIDLLNVLIKEQGKIKDITYLKNEHLGAQETDRKAIFDIYCENESGEKFIVELQKAKQNFFKDRSVYYSTFPIQDQAKRGDWAYELNAVYTIGILDFVFDEDKDSTEYYHHHVKLMETSRKKEFYSKLTFIYLEMPKFNKTEDELESHFDKWMYVLKNLSRLQERPRKLQERVFGQLFKIAEIAEFSYEERMRYEDSLKYYRDLKNVIDTGKEEGRIEGRIEKAIEIAKSLLDILEDNVIAEKTKLTLEEIKQLRNSNL